MENAASGTGVYNRLEAFGTWCILGWKGDVHIQHGGDGDTTAWEWDRLIW
jgi:hypothetical protein